MKQFLVCLILILPIFGARNTYAQTPEPNRIDSLVREISKNKEEIITLTLQRQNLFIYIGAAVSFLVLLLIFLVYRNLTLQKKANLIIKAEKENAEQQRLRAEKSEQFEQQLLANMSHEIRTPMNTVLGMTNLTLDTHLTPKQNKYLTAVKKSSENLLVIINNVLDRSKLSTGKIEPENIQFRLSEQINQVNEAMQHTAEKKGLILQTEIADDVPELLTGDPSRLKQVLVNLCENAIKFTDNGTVKVIVEKVEGTEGTLCFRVVDSGVSISAEKVAKLFESFHKTDASASLEYDGTDLGLSIAKTLMELDSGEIEVKRGNGSEFFFTITYETAAGKAAASLQGIKILIAEDNEYNQMVITDTLETLIKNIKVDVAENGKIALDKHMANDYDLILMDVQMPEMDGLEATEQIRKETTGRKKDIPIIALTADVLSADLSKCFEAGMNDHIPKPFTRDQLLNTLAKHYVLKHPTGNTLKNTAASNTVTNLSFLVDFCKGDKATMKKYIGIYLRMTPTNLEKINKTTGEKDYYTLSRTVHAMKAHLNYMGMKETRKLAEKIEICAKEQNNLAELPQLIYKLQVDCEKSMEELRSFE